VLTNKVWLCAGFVVMSTKPELRDATLPADELSQEVG